MGMFVWKEIDRHCTSCVLQLYLIWHVQPGRCVGNLAKTSSLLSAATDDRKCGHCTTMNMPGSLHTPAFSHYSLAWSPSHNNHLALASAANFGLVSNGRLHIISLVPPTLQLSKAYDTQDGLYDIAWSEIHENQIVMVSGDGPIKLWDVMLNLSASRQPWWWREMQTRKD
jgi:WD40 repeat protein